MMQPPASPPSTNYPELSVNYPYQAQSTHQQECKRRICNGLKCGTDYPLRTPEEFLSEGKKKKSDTFRVRVTAPSISEWKRGLEKDLRLNGFGRKTAQRIVAVIVEYIKLHPTGGAR